MPHAGGARGYGAMRRDGDIAPYRHAARVVRTCITHGALPAPCRARGAVWCRGSAAVGGTGRRALRSYRGRTETPPAKLSACATCYAHGALPGAMPHAWCARLRGDAARWGHRALPPLPTQNSHAITHRALPGAMPHAWCAPAPQKIIFVLLYIPLKSSLCPFVLKIHTCNIRTTTGHAHYPTPCRTRIARGGSPPRAARWLSGCREVRRPMGATNR